MDGSTAPSSVSTDSRGHRIGRHNSEDTGISLRFPLLSAHRIQRSHSAPEYIGVVLLKCGECRDLPGPGDGELKRRLGPVELTLLGVGACIGAGVFVLTGVEARVAGPSVALAFCLAAASSVFNGLCYAELSSRLPISGSAYLYAYCMFGELPAMIVVANQLLDYHIGAATMSRSLTAYIDKGLVGFGLTLPECFVECQPFPSFPWISVSLGAPAVLACVAIIVAGGAKTNATITAAMTVVKIGIIIVVIAVGTQRVDASRWEPFFPNGMGATLQAAATLNYAFIGYDVIANAAEETKNPQRDIPVAIVGALSICAVLYLFVCMVLCGMQDFNEIDAAAPVSSAFLHYDLFWVASIINLGAFFGMATGLLAGVYGQSRIYFALARDELAPEALKQPAVCSAWCGCLAGLLAALVNVRELASMLNIGVLLAYSTTAASVLRINAKRHTDKYGRQKFIGSENFWIGIVTILAVGLARGGSLWGPLSGLCTVALLAVMAWVCISREYSSCPGGAFRCPGLPVTPMVALVTNIFLACQLSWHAWLRLLVTSVIVTVAFFAFILRGLSLEERRASVCATVREAASAAGTNPGVCGSCQEPKGQKS